MVGQRNIVSKCAVVVGAAVLLAGTLGSTVPASAQWHRSDVGAGLAAGAVTGLALGAAAGAGCALQWQRVWDGYGWSVQRVQVCD